MAARNWRHLTVDEIKAATNAAVAIGPFGSRMKAERYVSSGVPVIRGNNISDTRALTGDFVFVSPETADELWSSNVFRGDLVFPHRGAIGQVGIVPEGAVERYMLSTSLMKLTCNRTVIEPEFLFYFFRSSAGQHELLKHASTVGTPGIGQPLASLRSITVPVPPLSEQRAIAHVLGALDDKIELNRRMNETLEAIARAIFKSWFIDFDPVRAKADGRDPGLPRHLADLFPDRFEDSELGETPTGWEATPLPQAILVNPARPLPNGHIAPYLDMANMPTATARPHQVSQRAFTSGMRFANGDTLVARITPCLENGKTCFVDFLDEGQVGWGSTEYIVLRPIDPLPPEFAYFLARTEYFRSFAISAMTGTSGRQRVPAESLKQLTIAVPPSSVAHRFGAIARGTIARMRANDEESATLSALRDALLPKLLSGELCVSEAERVPGRIA